MAGYRVGETDHLSDSRPSSIQYVLHGITTSSTTNFINQREPSFDFGELGEAIMFDGVELKSDEAKKNFFTTSGQASATLEMFPSWPMRFHPTPRDSSKSGGDSTIDSGSGNLEAESPITVSTTKKASNHQILDQNKQQRQAQAQEQIVAEMPTSDTSGSGGTTGPLQNQQQFKPQEQRKVAGSTSNKPLDAKTLRRLAQNREAAKKSRVRKKAYVQQLESSRIRLTQLEQDLQRARAQGLFLTAGGGGAAGNISHDAAIFDMEYARWLEDEYRHMSELRTGLQAHLSDVELRAILDGCLAHYDTIFRLKGVAAKSDVFHLINGMWATPAERCFLWMGGFRPSELLKILTPQLDPLTEHQLMGIYSLQQSSQQAEEALSQGLELLHQSLAGTVASGSLGGDRSNMGDYMGQMALALSKIANLEGFVRQADNLRQETLHQLCRTLTVRQAARCILGIGEYNNRLRALSSLWASRPRELDQC